MQPANNEYFGLTLSGGGFRATLFHLGVVRFLHEGGLLAAVRHICSVSGGSVLGAHLVLNWEKYTGTMEEFEGAASELISFVKSDVRGGIVRKWYFGWLSLVPHLGWHRAWSRTGMLEARYGSLYPDQTLAAFRKPVPGMQPLALCLPNVDTDLLSPWPTRSTGRPLLYILSTSMTTGQLCAFGGTGFWSAPSSSPRSATSSSRHKEWVSLDSRPVAFAVASSSAFPPLFPPTLLQGEQLGMLPQEWENESLTDGGVYDNLGIEMMEQVIKRGFRLDAVLVSDAGGMFRWVKEKHFGSIFPRALRTTDILMKRIVDLELQDLQQRQKLPAPYIPCRIDDLAAEDAHPCPLPDEVKRKTRLIRTDLDAFTDPEIHALIRWGYCVARDAWKKAGRQTRAGDIEKLPKRPWYPVGHPVAKAISVGVGLDQSQKSRQLFWSRNDRYSYLGLCLVLVYLFIVSVTLCWATRGFQTFLVSAAPASVARLFAATVTSPGEELVTTDLKKLKMILANEADPEQKVKPGKYVAFIGVVGKNWSDDQSREEGLPHIVVYDSADQTGASCEVYFKRKREEKPEDLRGRPIAILGQVGKVPGNTSNWQIRDAKISLLEPGEK
jgi:predicted acylesterase/phospholipase RssA